MAEPIRIANASGFYGDRLAAVHEQVTLGDIDVVTGDYLAELTMLLLWKAKQKSPEKGYAVTFLRQMEATLGEIASRGVKVVANAGGLNPAGLADELRTMIEGLGLSLRVAHVEGDNLLPVIDDLVDLEVQTLTANAYLGAWGIAEALGRGVDIVVTGRVADAALVVGPAAWHHEWRRDDWDALAGAVVAGHVLECGAQATGGNFAFFHEVQDLTRPGFPIAEIAADGSSVITKHEGTGGAVTVGTITAQILYEIDEPAYRTPDVVAHFDTIELSQIGPDCVEITGVQGSPAPELIKVATNHLGGYRNSMTLVLVGLDIEEKAMAVERSLRAALLPEHTPETLVFDLAISSPRGATTNAGAASYLTITAMDRDPRKVGRAFSSAVVEMALANYPGFFATAPPTGESPYGVYHPVFVPRSEITQIVVLDDGERIEIDDPPTGEPRSTRDLTAYVAVPVDATRSVPLGAVVGARSGDKGGDANVGVWSRSPESFGWLVETLTVERFKELLPEARDLDIERFVLPNLTSLNFVVHGLLGRGVASSTRFDPQAKSLGEWLRSRVVDVPASLLRD